jgi:hypothetical protein
LTGSDTPITAAAGSSIAEELLESQARYGTLQAGRKVEEILSGLAARLQKEGFSRIVVAGGETSGAVSLALGVGTLRIGAEIAPGVPGATSSEASGRWPWRSSPATSAVRHSSAMLLECFHDRDRAPRESCPAWKVNV